MQVRVLFFGVLKDLAGCASASVTLPEHATVADLLAEYQRQLPKINHYSRSLAVSLNREYASQQSVLHEGDEVGLLPPVSGGAGPVSEPLIRLVQDRIQAGEILAHMQHPEDGAVVIFDGVVRNHSRNRRTLYLEYEAYEEMALQRMRVLVAEALGRFAIRDIALVHRLGRIEIGETSVLIAAYSAHRAAAFDACRWLIDTLKRTVPIWKKEYFEDGAMWADGEPFPEEISAHRNLSREAGFK